jgi:hypothetical protein
MTKRYPPLVMDTGVPRGIFGSPAPVPAEFPSSGHGCGILPNSRGFRIYIYNYYLIIYKIFNKHPSKFIRGGKQHQGWCCFMFGICGSQREDADHKTTCRFVVSMCGRAKKRRRTRNHTLLGVVSCSACGSMCGRVKKRRRTRNHTLLGVVLCSACGRAYVDHERGCRSNSFVFGILLMKSIKIKM